MTTTSHRGPRRAAIAAACLLAGTGAQAATFEFGDVRGSFDSTITAGIGVRASNPDCKLVTVNHHAVAEHALAMLVALSRGFPARDQEVRRGAWARIPTRRLAGSTLGILGLGRIGQALATRARGLEMNVIAYDPYPPIEFARQWNVSLVSLEELWPRCDSISLHLPGGPATKHLINSATLAQMKRGAYLVNTARGSLIDEAALVDALRSGQLGGAGLDVFETEPLPTTSPLIDLPSVLLSGHVAGFDVESQFDTLTMSADTILQLYRGEWPADRIQNLKQLTGRWSW